MVAGSFSEQVYIPSNKDSTNYNVSGEFLSRITKWIEKIRNRKKSDEWYFAGMILLISAFMMFAIRGDSDPPTESSSILSFLMFHLSISLLWSGISAFVKSSTTGFDEQHASSDTKPTGTRIIKKEFYPKDNTQLFARSDSLDTARSNLRTGTGLFLGIGAAISLWLLNTSITPQITFTFLLGASLILTLCAVLSILFSFADVSKWYSNFSINENLVGFASSDNDYIEQVQDILLSKEDVLSRMRKSIGVGLLLFIVGVALALLVPVYQVIPTTPDIFWTSDRLGSIAFASAVCLCIFLIMLSSMIVGKRYLGILGSSDFE